jgi:hypothetical protein
VQHSKAQAAAEAAEAAVMAVMIWVTEYVGLFNDY